MKLKFKKTKSKVGKLRDKYLKKGIELVNITTLCEAKIVCGGWCNDINEPDETIHHIQIWYREENVAVINSKKSYIIDEDNYLLHEEEDKVTGNDFIIFKKCKKVKNNGRNENKKTRRRRN